jgi:hypothetical protein
MGEAKNLMAEAEKRPDCYDYNGVLDIFDEWFPNMVTWLNDPRESENARPTAGNPATSTQGKALKAL